MALRCQLKWGSKSFQLKTLAITGMNDLIDDSLIIAARRVLDQMTLFLPDLAAEGLTQEILDEFEALIVSTETAMNNQKNKINERDNKRYDRINKGNELYDSVVNYCDIGKRVYAMTNPAKYNDYLIYTSVSPGSLTAPANLRYNTQYYKIEWDAVENATSYQLEISSDGVNYTELVSQSENEFSHIPYESHSWIRCRARNSGGYGEYSQVLEIWYYEPLPAPANFQAVIIPGHQYKLSWDLIHSVETYKIYVSDVPFGDPESSFTLLYETSALEYTGSVTPGRRYYFKVTSNNSYQPESGFSSTMYVEVTGV